MKAGTVLAVFAVLGCAATGTLPRSEPPDHSARFDAPECGDSVVAVKWAPVAGLDSVRAYLGHTDYRSRRLTVTDSVAAIANQRELQEELVRLYPPDLRDAGKGGTVSYFVVVDAAGKLIHRRLLNPSGYLSLDQAAASLSEKMEFYPALIGNCRAMSAAIIPIIWRSM